MSRQRSHDTAPEVALRSALHRRGLRFSIHRRPVDGLRREADIVFPRERAAIFVDGCFWHGCPDHATHPKRNESFWRDKILANQIRDKETDSRLAAAGWLPIRVWEHEDPDEAADRIDKAVRLRRSDPDQGPAHPPETEGGTSCR